MDFQIFILRMKRQSEMKIFVFKKNSIDWSYPDIIPIKF